MEKLQKTYPRNYNLLMVQDLWQVHYQILSIIFLKELIDINSNTLMKNVKHVKFNISIVAAFWNSQIAKFIRIQCLCCNKNYQRKFDEKLKEQYFNTYRFSNNDNNKFILLL